MFVLFDWNGLMVVPDYCFQGGINFLDSLSDHESEFVFLLDERVIGGQMKFQDEAVRLV